MQMQWGKIIPAAKGGQALRHHAWGPKQRLGAAAAWQDALGLAKKGFLGQEGFLSIRNASSIGSVEISLVMTFECTKRL